MRTSPPVSHLLDARGGPPPSGTPSAESRWSASDEAVWQARELRWEPLLDEAERLGPDPRLADRTDEQLVRDLAVGAAELAAATCRWLELLAELVVRRVWAEQGARTPTQWLSWKLGTAPSTGREHVRVALRLRELPAVRERFAAGRLSYSKVRALTRVTVPGVEDLLLAWADEATAAELERVVRGFVDHQRQWVGDDEETTDDRRWSLRSRSDGAGTTAITLRVPDGEAYRITPATLAEVLVDTLAAAASAEAPADTSGLDRHTLVVQVDAHALTDATLVADVAGDDRDTDPDDGPRVGTVGEVRAGEPRPTGEHVAARDGSGRIRGMSRATLRRLACAAGVSVAVVDRRGSPIDVGRRTRKLSASLRRALHLRDRACTFPGCRATRHLHAHHVHHWTDGGPTDLDNLVLVCSFHHRFVHEYGWTIDVHTDGRHRYAPPGRAPVVHSPPLPGASAEAPVAARAGRGEDDLRADSPWNPRRDDLSTAITVLQQELDARRALALAA